MIATGGELFSMGSENVFAFLTMSVLLSFSLVKVISQCERDARLVSHSGKKNVSLLTLCVQELKSKTLVKKNTLKMVSVAFVFEKLFIL